VGEHPEVHAIFAVSELVAIGAFNFLNEAGIVITTQIAIFGFSNWFMPSLLTPKLTIIDQHVMKL
jgi:DNA-binding LacI/PurR family transcriptional regulator